MVLYMSRMVILRANKGDLSRQFSLLGSSPYIQREWHSIYNEHVLDFLCSLSRTGAQLKAKAVELWRAKPSVYEYDQKLNPT